MKKRVLSKEIQSEIKRQEELSRWIYNAIKNVKPDATLEEVAIQFQKAFNNRELD